MYCTMTGRCCVALPNAALQNMGMHAQLFLQGGASALLGGQPRMWARSLSEACGTFRWSLVRVDGQSCLLVGIPQNSGCGAGHPVW